ncbi:MAG: hypothetical protein QOI11_3894 [Candidatus Eremiobacteraeota bacterium]|nr:hypothetical protein [Candidatus Eremiobacteraeota bacterium]
MIHALLAAAAVASAAPAPAPTTVPASALYRVVALACTGERLAIAGGAVLRLAGGASCAAVVPGRALALALDADGRAAPRALTREARPASEIPRSAFVLAPAAERNADEAQPVTVTIAVTVPPRTPPGDDVYLSTERSSYAPAEIRMDRVDARHYRLALRLHRDARVLFRVTRGSYGTIERDAARALPPAHIAEGRPDAHLSVTVAAWADID